MINSRLHKSASPGSVFEATTIEFDERTGNVYENKGSAPKSTTPNPSSSEKGSSYFPSLDKEGLGVVGLCGLWVLCALA